MEQDSRPPRRGPVAGGQVVASVRTGDGILLENKSAVIYGGGGAIGGAARAFGLASLSAAADYLPPA